MFSWVRRIRVRSIDIFGVKLELEPLGSDSQKAVEEIKPLMTRGEEPIAKPEPKTVGPATPAIIEPQEKPILTHKIAQGTPSDAPATLTVYGEVVKTIAEDLGIRIRNEEEVREFWDTHQIDSMLDWAGKGPPVFSIGRREDKARCRPGDEVSMTVIVQDRVNGKRGIRTVGFEVLRQG